MSVSQGLTTKHLPNNSLHFADFELQGNVDVSGILILQTHDDIDKGSYFHL